MYNATTLTTRIAVGKIGDSAIVNDHIKTDTCRLDSIRTNTLLPAYCGCSNIYKTGTMTLIFQAYDSTGYRTGKWQQKSYPFKNTDVAGNCSRNPVIRNRQFLLKSGNVLLKNIQLPSDCNGILFAGIIDVQGKTVLSRNIDFDQQASMDIARSGIGSGTYILLIKGEGTGSIVKRFVVNK